MIKKFSLFDGLVILGIALLLSYRTLVVLVQPMPNWCAWLSTGFLSISVLAALFLCATKILKSWVNHNVLVDEVSRIYGNGFSWIAILQGVYWTVATLICRETSALFPVFIITAIIPCSQAIANYVFMPIVLMFFGSWMGGISGWQIAGIILVGVNALSAIIWSRVMKKIKKYEANTRKRSF